MRTGISQFCSFLLMITGCCGSVATASPHIVTISGVEVVNDAQGDMVIVTGEFSPALPCATQAFWIYPTESKYKEIFSLLLAAKTTSSSVKFEHSYCSDNGLSRGNRFMLQ